MTTKKTKTAKHKKKKGAQTIKAKTVDDLTAKQQAFVREYPEDFNGAQAVIRAGYSPKGARQMSVILLTNIVIQQEVKKQVERRNRAIEKKTDVSALWVIDKLKRTVERCMQITPVMVKVGDKWIESGEFTFAFTGSNQALKMIGDYLGMWKTNVNLTGQIDINHIEDIPTDMLLAVLQQISESGQKQITLDAEGKVVE